MRFQSKLGGYVFVYIGLAEQLIRFRLFCPDSVIALDEPGFYGERNDRLALRSVADKHIREDVFVVLRISENGIHLIWWRTY